MVEFRTRRCANRPISTHHSAELWLHPREKIAYLSTFDGIVYSIDVKDPAKPVIVDSIVADARLINDVMTSEDGKVLVHTRQGASDRRAVMLMRRARTPRKLSAARVSIRVAPHWVRIAPSVYNDMHDVERLLEALS